MEGLPPGYHLAEVARQLHCCSRQLRSFLCEQIRPSRLSDSEFLLLWACHQSGDEPTIQSQLVLQIGLSAAQLSGIVERLHKRELLQVERSDRDRRKQLLSLTELGRDVLHAAIQSLEESSQRVRRELGQTQLQQLSVLASRLVAACREVDEHAAQVASPHDCCRESG